jgi:transcriptional regulator
MYLPPAFREDRIEVMQALMRASPLATLVTGGATALTASLLPVLIDASAPGAGVLRAHMARANGQLAALATGAEALVIFQGPQAYVTPSWYPSKAEHGKVVPTWNYATVHAWGTPRLIEDPEWLRAQVDALTRAQEEERTAPWSLEDAPRNFIDAQLRGIVGIEIPIARIEGKWKVSQNRPQADQQGVVDGLRAERASAMAALVAERGREPGRRAVLGRWLRAFLT